MQKYEEEIILLSDGDRIDITGRVVYSILTCDNNQCTGERERERDTWVGGRDSFYLCAYLTRMQVKYLDEVLTVRRDPSVRTLTRDK